MNLYISIYARGFIYNTHKYIEKIEGAINVEKIRKNTKFENIEDNKNIMDIKELFIELLSLINKTTKDFVENNFSTLDLKYQSAKKLNDFLTPNLTVLSKLINEKLKVNELRLQKLQKLKVNGTPNNINLNRYIKEFNNIMAKKKKDNTNNSNNNSNNNGTINNMRNRNNNSNNNGTINNMSIRNRNRNRNNNGTINNIRPPNIPHQPPNNRPQSPRGTRPVRNPIG
jgi:hypothetical protein